jgi:hypothetical protein
MLYKLYSGFGFALIAGVLTCVIALPYLKTDALDGDSRPTGGSL